MDVTLRNACEDDMVFLHQLRDYTMRKYLEQAGMQVTVDAYEARIRYEFHSAQIVEVNSQAIGLFKATYNSQINHWQLIQIQIAPEFQGLGIGSDLLKALIRSAAKSGATVGLSVIESNPAMMLYTNLGFKVISREGDEYLMKLQA
ncbi:GNAT family N-acetyltransferase [Photobacterium minamisatsumaniensis]|uniref:GNAT family N-acetyltransferase n=1 Tax=Photobacterium minamisatsumaniensis TaxID=2910233 RepID=UPI003D0DEED5